MGEGGLSVSFLKSVTKDHTQGPNFCILWPLLVYQDFLIFSPMLGTGPRAPISHLAALVWGLIF